MLPQQEETTLTDAERATKPTITGPAIATTPALAEISMLHYLLVVGAHTVEPDHRRVVAT